MSLAAVLFIAAGLVIITGAALFGNAKAGPQNTLGGIIAMLVVIASAAALALVARI